MHEVIVHSSVAVLQFWFIILILVFFLDFESFFFILKSLITNCIIKLVEHTISSKSGFRYCELIKTE